MSEPGEASVRSEVRAWLEAHWDPERSLREWRELLADSGWGVPTWPPEWYGRGLPPALAKVVQEEWRRSGAVGTATGSGMGLAAPTLLEHGSDDLKRRLLRPIITGEHTWCQLFSEPGSGSDLAGLTTRAQFDGEHWIVNGQKVWTTSAHHARYGMLLARTDWDVSKHRGITYFVLEMNQPGVEVRPLRQMNGHASFNEVFLTDARVAAADVIGAVGGGGTVALTTLAHERGLAALRGSEVPGEGRVRREYREELAHVMAPYVWYPQRAGRADLVIERAHATGRGADPVLRDAVAQLHALVRASEWTQLRAPPHARPADCPAPRARSASSCASHIARAAAASTPGSPARRHARGRGRPARGAGSRDLLSVPGQSIAGALTRSSTTSRRARARSAEGAAVDVGRVPRRRRTRALHAPCGSLGRALLRSGEARRAGARRWRRCPL
jgi:alkylation response protein AidB-like acyl-CoA dehydrogenase